MPSAQRVKKPEPRRPVTAAKRSAQLPPKQPAKAAVGRLKPTTPGLGVRDVLDWDLKLLQILDALCRHMNGGALSAMCIDTSAAGTPLSQVEALLAAYRDDSWRSAAAAYKFASEELQDSPTLLMRLVDMMFPAADRVRRTTPIHTSVWTEYGVTSEERQLILSLYLPRAGRWSSHLCDASHVASVLDPA